MKFKNETGKNAKYRLGSIKSGFNWYTIRPEETADIPEHTGMALNLTPIEEGTIEEEIEKAIEEDKVDNDESEADDSDADATFQEDTEAYKKKLIGIGGVGKKTAEDIVADYPTEKELKQAIKVGVEIHNRDDVDAAIKETFKE